MNVSRLKYNPNNPRRIQQSQLEKLKDSIQNFPEMMELRPMVYDPATMQILGGNQRLAAIKALDMKEIPDNWAVAADKLTDAQKKEFILKDNIPLGEWDFEKLAAEFSEFDIEELGAVVGEDVAGGGAETENPYTSKIISPVYEPKNEKPELDELVDTDKYEGIMDRIEAAADVPEDVKDFLRVAAQRHIVFDYGKIADYYAHATPEVQRLMEDSALVIIDIDDAIEKGYVKLAHEIGEAYEDEYPEAEQ